MKLAFPEEVFLLRGNHEGREINKVYGFYSEVVRRMKSVAPWNAFQDSFDWLPISALLSGRILCMHGGISPHWNAINDVNNIQRPLDMASSPLAVDILWSDPKESTTGWEKNLRGTSYTFGPGVVNEFIRRMQLDLIVRAHQVVQDGYEFFAGRKLVTIFSAPHFCGEFKNSADILHVGEDLLCTFIILARGTIN